MSKPNSSSSLSVSSFSVFDLGGAALLAVFVGFTYSEYATSKQEFVDRSIELTTSTSWVAKIETLRARPDQATLASHSARALAKAIEQSAAKAKITSKQIASIEPQSPRRAGDTPYMEHATIVHLEGITLPQFAQLAVNLRQLDASLGQLHLTTVRIDAPYRQDEQNEATERWNANAEFTLTYFVYSPKSSGS